MSTPKIVVLLKKNQAGNQGVPIPGNAKIVQRKVSVMIACRYCAGVFPNLNVLHQHMRQTHFEQIRVKQYF